MTEELEGYITVNEAAKQMGRSAEQVRRYLREGKLAGKRIGGQWFIREAAVLYRTQREEMNEMERIEPIPATTGWPVTGTRTRMAVFESINGRREEIRRRWESMGISVDAAELVREIREEER
ncbi:MAG: helix-turn-helix domain-containing protein [Dehalococcoidia bacterium]|nr:helix-turn-helix domain-containing protein [Dehalococcoidia bacterium]